MTRPAPSAGSLTVVGTGMLLAGQVTPEALSAIRAAQKLLHLVADPVTRAWLDGQNRSGESLFDAYAPGKPRDRSYAEMVERILAPVRAGLEVCAAFYGHPGVFVQPGHEAIRRARAEGYDARMLPAVSAEDCLFADLGIDPGRHGCQSFEATDFLVRRRIFDPRSHLVLWQIGGIGVTTFETAPLWSREGLEVLAAELARIYPAGHEVTVYEAAQYPVCDPVTLRVSLRELPQAPVTLLSTLYVPPIEPAPLDPEMLDRLRISPPARPGGGG